MLKKTMEFIKHIDKKWLIASVIGLILLIMVLIIVLKSDNGIFFVKENDGEKFANEYNILNNKTDSLGKKYLEINIPKKNPIKYVNYKDVINAIENGKDAVVYFGYAEECHYCRTAVSILTEVSIEKELKEVYYVDIKKQGNKYKKLYDLIGEKFIDEENGEKIIKAPLVIFIVNGEISSYNKGTLYFHRNPYYPMSESMRNGLKRIYSSGIDNVLESIQMKESYKNEESTQIS